MGLILYMQVMGVARKQPLLLIYQGRLLTTVYYQVEVDYIMTIW